MDGRSMLYWMKGSPVGNTMKTTFTGYLLTNKAFLGCLKIHFSIYTRLVNKTSNKVSSKDTKNGPFGVDLRVDIRCTTAGSRGR